MSSLVTANQYRLPNAAGYRGMEMMPAPDAPQWGLNSNITPRLGARLVQESNRLHYLADRAGICGAFGEAQALTLENTFPYFIDQLDRMLISSELCPRRQRCVMLRHRGLTCEADTLGSHGYVYIALYPTPAA